MTPPPERRTHASLAYTADDYRAELARVERNGRIFSVAIVAAGVLVVVAIVAAAIL